MNRYFLILVLLGKQIHAAQQPLQEIAVDNLPNNTQIAQLVNRHFPNADIAATEQVLTKLQQDQQKYAQTYALLSPLVNSNQILNPELLQAFKPNEEEMRLKYEQDIQDSNQRFNKCKKKINICSLVMSGSGLVMIGIGSWLASCHKH